VVLNFSNQPLTATARFPRRTTTLSVGPQRHNSFLTVFSPLRGTLGQSGTLLKVSKTPRFVRGIVGCKAAATSLSECVAIFQLSTCVLTASDYVRHDNKTNQKVRQNERMRACHTGG